MTSRSVAVVGAGPSGLVTTKELLQEGHTVTCFERTDSLGGVFRFRSDPGAVGVWETCRLTSSILVTSFSDFFPAWERNSPYEHRQMMHHEYVAYLTSYARDFDVLPRIRFGCQVVDISPDPAAGWRVTYARGQPATEEVQHFDAVAICSGLHRVPHVPNIPGIATFRGQILHAAHYKSPSSIKGRSAVFIGAGESGSDIVAEASAALDRSYMSLRRGAFVIPRLLNGRPNDYTGTRLLYSLPGFVTRRTDPEAEALRQRVGRWLFPLRLPLITASRVRALILPTTRPVRERHQAEIEDMIMSLRARAGGNHFETFATKTQGFVEAVVDGRCELRPAIQRITPSGVRFVDGTTADTEAIVLCTGFETPSVPFLDASVDLQRLYKRCFDPTYREELAFIGFLRPPIGSIPPMSELQARWYAQILSGKASLPSSEEMADDIRTDQTVRRRYHAQVFDRMPYIVDYAGFMDEVAELIGCKPRLSDLVTRPRLLYKLHTVAFGGVQYRLRGPHARPQMAAKVLLHTPSHARAVRFLDLFLAELAGVFGLDRLRPHLSLRSASRRRRQPHRRGVRWVGDLEQR